MVSTVNQRAGPPLEHISSKMFPRQECTCTRHGEWVDVARTDRTAVSSSQQRQSPASAPNFEKLQPRPQHPPAEHLCKQGGVFTWWIHRSWDEDGIGRAVGCIPIHQCCARAKAFNFTLGERRIKGRWRAHEEACHRLLMSVCVEENGGISDFGRFEQVYHPQPLRESICRWRYAGSVASRNV